MCCSQQNLKNIAQFLSDTLSFTLSKILKLLIKFIAPALIFDIMSM